MNICEYSRSRSFVDLGQRSFTYENLNFLFSETTWQILTKFSMYALRYMEMKINPHGAGHMTKMATMPIYGINPLDTNQAVQPKKIARGFKFRI